MQNYKLDGWLSLHIAAVVILCVAFALLLHVNLVYTCRSNILADCTILL